MRFPAERRGQLYSNAGDLYLGALEKAGLSGHACLIVATHHGRDQGNGRLEQRSLELAAKLPI